jgi:hypothetical protein
MKKIIYSTLVVILTFITLVVMVTFQNDLYKVTEAVPYEIQDSNEKPKGTGYIFNDLNNGINIPVN